MACYPRFECLYGLVSNPRLGCFWEIDSRGYGTHLNGTDPPRVHSACRDPIMDACDDKVCLFCDYSNPWTRFQTQIKSIPKYRESDAWKCRW